jgi:pimeloyl-ACP methyl ester carboxylesterase
MHQRSLLRMTAFAAASTLLFSACGGGDDGPAPAPAPVPEETRAQDTRSAFAADPATLAFDALAGVAVDTDRWSGVLGGASYRIEVPKTGWNGKLVMYAHGYVGAGNALVVTNPSIRRYLLEQGFAWAASSYAKNYYDVRAGVEDTNALAKAFVQLAAANGRTLAAPTRTYLIGHSMGGHITAAAIEAEAAATAVHKQSYDGAVPMCGVVGDTELFDYFAGYQLAAQQLAGVPAASFPTTDWATLAADVRTTLFASPTSFAAPTVQGAKLKEVVMNLTGGPRPIFDQGFANNGLQNVVWGTFGGDGTINGILNKNVVDTQRFSYRFTASDAVLASFNASIAKAVAAPDANRLRSDGLRWIPKVNGEVKIPVVSLHTLGDLYVPFRMEQVYRARVEAKGNGGWLVQRAVRAPSHCDFTVAEQVGAFAAMVTWAETGVKPAGDDVVTSATVADPAYGCTYTVNAGGADDNPTTIATRALMPACPVP